MRMDDLAKFVKARRAYEFEFKVRGINLDDMEARIDDHELKLTGHVFLAELGDQHFKISLTDHAVPCAFARSTGVNDEIDLLQIVVNIDNLMIDECAELFSCWVQHGALGKPTVALTSSFASKSSVRRE